MPDRVDGPMDGVKPAGGDSPVDGARGQPEVDQLPVGDDPVLVGREAGDRPVPAVNPLFSTVWVVRSGFTRHGGEVAAIAVTRGTTNVTIGITR